MDDIRRTIEMRAPIDRVWRHLTEPELLSRWLMPNTFRPVLGRAFTMDCPPGIGSGAPIEARVTILEPPAGNRARLAYTWAIDEPPLTTLLDIRLTERGGTTRLDLVHSGWTLEPSDAGVRERHAGGWDHLLENLLKPLVEVSGIRQS